MMNVPNEPTAVQVMRNTSAAYKRYIFQRLRCTLGSRLPRASTPHLLILAWLFPPKVSGGVYRPLSFVQRAIERGWQVTVVAGPPVDNPSAAGAYLARQVPDSARVLRVVPPQHTVSYRAFPRIDGGFLNVLETFDLVRDALNHSPTVIVPTGPPFHNFVAGWMLSRYYRAPLVLDYRDEWTECPFDFVRIGNCDLAWERRCIRSASAVVMTTDSFIEHAIERFPELDRKRVHKVMNGWEPSDMPTGELELERPKGTHSTEIEIAYVGNLGDHVPVSKLLADLSTLVEQAPALARRVAVRFVGDRAAGADRLLSQFQHRWMLRLDGQVPKPTAIQVMRSASALLIINEPSLSRYIPGKLFDYIASGTPILIYGADGEAGRIVKQLGAGVEVTPGATNQLGTVLDQLGNNQIAISPARAQEWLAAHTRQRSADAMLNILQKVSNRA